MTIPDEKQPAVTRALREAFGTTTIDDLQQLTAGLSSALVFRIMVRGTPYYLRVIMRTDAGGDPTHMLACVRPASHAGLAPQIRYASVEDRILITDFVEPRPLPDDPARVLAAEIARLHALPPFPKRMKYLDAANGCIRKFEAAKLLPESRTGHALRGFDEAMQVYPRSDADHVATHNDLKPENVLFDGTRFWFVDWEAACLNDRYVDLGVVANFFVNDDDGEHDFLQTYFGEPASEYQRARFYLMKQILHMFYASIFMLLAAGAGVPIAADAQAPDFEDFHRRLLSGEITMKGAEARLQYALTHLERAVQNMRAPRFQDSVATVTAAGAGK
jgi:aminoglycoside phosphotransferase